LIFNSNQLNNIKEVEFDSNNIEKELTFQEAIASNDVSNCDYVVEKNLIESCKLELIECNDDACYFDKARYKMDEQLCFNIDDEDQSAGCSASIKISDIKQRAVLEDDIQICEEFENLETINFCRDNYYIASASRYNKDDLSFCNSILNEVIKNECLK
jgi:hypothetical protein